MLVIYWKKERGLLFLVEEGNLSNLNKNGTLDLEKSISRGNNI